MATQPSNTENHHDASAEMLSAPNAQKHLHPINRGDEPGTAKASDFDPGGPEVPARATRGRVDPGAANSQRRAPLIDVTAITSPAGTAAEGDAYAAHEAHSSSTASPVPRKL
jgi:hypothetical protein